MKTPSKHKHKNTHKRGHNRSKSTRSKTKRSKITKNKSSNRHSKHHSNHNHINKLNCSPNPDNKNKSYTCYSDTSLEKMKKFWNIRHPDNKISSDKPKEIWEQLKDNMNHSCKRESCWLRSKFMEGNLDSELLNYTFAPSAPKEWNAKPNEWLSSLDIEGVMKQYENYYKCFEFLGPSPIDYDHHKLYGECVWEELCNLNISEQMKRNINKIGIILNTHPHNKGGEHWISMFVNIKRKQIVYFDSNGNKPPTQVSKLMNEIKNQGKQLGIDFKLYANEIEHQKTDSECGMYCLYFIIEMLKDNDLDYFLKNEIHDNKVFKLRKKYFNLI